MCDVVNSTDATIDGIPFDLYLWSLKIKYDYFQNIDIPGSEPEFFLVTVDSFGMLDHLLVNWKNGLDSMVPSIYFTSA